jgi:hypothetical protein
MQFSFASLTSACLSGWRTNMFGAGGRELLDLRWSFLFHVFLEAGKHAIEKAVNDAVDAFTLQ